MTYSNRTLPCLVHFIKRALTTEPQSSLHPLQTPHTNFMIYLITKFDETKYTGS